MPTKIISIRSLAKEDDLLKEIGGAKAAKELGIPEGANHV